MRSKIGILYVLLALVLTATNVTANGHASSHNAANSGSCLLCVHAAGSNSAIAPASTAVSIILMTDRPDRPYASPDVLAITLRVKSSRAPPAID